MLGFLRLAQHADFDRRHARDTDKAKHIAAKGGRLADARHRIDSYAAAHRQKPTSLWLSSFQVDTGFSSFSREAYGQELEEGQEAAFQAVCSSLVLPRSHQACLVARNFLSCRNRSRRSIGTIAAVFLAKRWKAKQAQATAVRFPGTDGLAALVQNPSSKSQA